MSEKFVNVRYFIIFSSRKTLQHPSRRDQRKKLLNTWTQAGLAGVAHECCSFLAGDPREDWEEISPARPRNSLRVAAPPLRRYLNPASCASYTNSAHPICLYFVAILCHWTKQNNASSKTKVKTALVALTKTPSFLQVKHDWTLSLIYWDTESLSTLS